MNPRWLPMMAVSTAVAIAMQIATPAGAQSAGLQSSDLLKMRSVGDVQVSPDGTRAAYVVQNNDQPGRPYSQIWVVNLTDGQSIRFGGEPRTILGTGMVAGWPVDRLRGTRSRETRAGDCESRWDPAQGPVLAACGYQQPTAAYRETIRLVPRQQQRCLCLFRARPRNRGGQRRPRRYHPLSL